ncbi:MAG: glycine cleavage system protein GcvH [Candidatus Omnitrophica bacterium]|nr:glycine cleavage system protein GcvH [Candidatus Omnitrophota bacterium]MCK5287878.1 glycine cleavage system protein GcvH [Candidatus Omnitrophota bacterium]
MIDLKFTKSHEWVKLDGEIVTIGITDYAQHQLGDVVFIELPEMGDKFDQGSQFGTIESTKAATELFIPLTGEVVEINSELSNNPQWVNENPLGKGWMIKIKVNILSEMGSLLDEGSYKKILEDEINK